jgi:acyl-CoA reductase-like NAD-dependent aldehyde dehydrogenase
MGRGDDKTEKNVFAARAVLRDILGRPARGVLRLDDRRKVIEIGRPVGVVLALMPVTNPVATTFSTALIALKGGNALVIRAHPRAADVTARAVALLRSALSAGGASADLVQAIPPVDRNQVRCLLRHPDVDLVLATGSTGLVKEAMASGKPTLGAGAGNAPVWICDDADLRGAARTVVASKSFDNGLICGSEQHLIVDAAVAGRVTAALEEAGAAVLSAPDVERLEAALFDGGRLRPDLVGRSAAIVARHAGLAVTPGTRLLIAPVPDTATAGPWGLERLAPVLGLYVVAGEEDALVRCRQLLARSGAGHTAALHTSTRARALRFARSVPASRILVNGPASQGCIGSGNGLTPSLTLACGPEGGSTTTDNISYQHLLQITRVAVSWN